MTPLCPYCTDRGGCLDGLDCSFKHFLRQTKVGGAAVHDALVIVVLGRRRAKGQKSFSEEELGGVNLKARRPARVGISALHTSLGNLLNLHVPVSLSLN